MCRGDTTAHGRYARRNKTKASHTKTRGTVIRQVPTPHRQRRATGEIYPASVVQQPPQAAVQKTRNVRFYRGFTVVLSRAYRISVALSFSPSAAYLRQLVAWLVSCAGDFHELGCPRLIFPFCRIFAAVSSVFLSLCRLCEPTNNFAFLIFNFQ